MFRVQMVDLVGLGMLETGSLTGSWAFEVNA